MSEKVLLSFVIPVYNVEKYLNECLDSIFDPSASEDEYEVIAIDDGSTDGSPEILKTYGHHKNFRIITQENAGQGPARNVGIKAATGKYISFVDSDDYLLPGAVPTLLGWARESDCDIVEFEFEYKMSHGLAESWYYEPKTQRTPASGKGKNVFAEWVKQKAFLPVPWLRIYKRSFLTVNSLYFSDLRIAGEDAEWQVRCFFYADRINYFPVILYSYRVRAGSIARTSLSKGITRCRDLIQLITAHNSFKKAVEPNEENLCFLKELGGVLASSLELAINIAYKDVPKKERDALFNEMRKLREVLALSVSKKGRRMYRLTRWLPDRMAFWMYKIF